MNKHRLILLFVFGMLLRPLFGQTILAPDLQCVENNNVNGNITLYWTNAPTNPCGAFVEYTIYASQNGPNGPFNPIAVTTQSATSFVLANYLSLSTTWYFYMEAKYNCPGATALQSDTINNLNPATPKIINVDVTPGGDVIFNWAPSSSPQTHGYIIYYGLANGNATPLGTVTGRFNTTYLDVAGDPSTEPLVYTVAAVDSCGGVSAFDTPFHFTIYQTASIARCQRQVNINWTNYFNWPADVLEYQIWVNKNNAGFAMDGTTGPGTLVYAFTNFNDGDSLCLVVRAISAADTTIVSNSNMVCMHASIIQPPSYIYITNLTVNTDDQIEMTWMTDTIAQLLVYKIMQSTNGTSYLPVYQFGVPSPLQLFEMHIDSAVFPNMNPYYYQVVAVDSCQNQYPTPYGKTIHLDGELYDFYLANLKWNAFELEYATVTNYKLYRNYGSGYQLLATLPVGTTEYSDSLQQFLDQKGVFCYRIEATYQLNLPNGYSATLSSWSNEKCIIHRPIIYVPNAFAPNGLNNVFKPTIIYGEKRGYSMIIYNKWGGRVFESNDYDTGWDGTQGGKASPPGGYAYFIEFTADDGVVVQRQGMLLLVK
ncbi:MAG: gliding motility-associated C-terminal domain-containing protein [Bacteroidetes bacterium]|nr:gliding motility-associated C-terminal domain-containing protein [Bacteroidota bacterium]